MMIETLRRVGNSYALLLDKSLLDLLGVSAGSQVNLTVTNGRLIVTPVNPTLVDADNFQAGLHQVMKTRKTLLKRLSQ